MRECGEGLGPEIEGLDVSYPFPVAVHEGKKITEQIDGAVVLGGTRFLLESKAWKDKVSRGPLALLGSQLLRRPPTTMGMVFTLKGYTDLRRAELRTLLGTKAFASKVRGLEKVKDALEFIQGWNEKPASSASI